MKRILPLLFVTLISAARMLAQNTPQPENPAYVPYHQYFQKHHNDLQKSNPNSRSLVYPEIGSRHDSWNNTASMWNGVDSGVYHYNWAAQETDDFYVNYVSSNWVSNYKDMYTYDGNSNQLTSTTQTWDNTNSVFVNSQRTANTYTSFNRSANSVNQSWVPWISNWRNTSQYVYTYNGSNYQTQSLYQLWDTIANAWVNSSETNTTYTSNGYYLTYQYLNWNLGTSSWDNSGQYLYTYDVNNLETSYIYQSGSGTTWTNSSKYIFTYTGTLQTERITQTWNAGTSNWDNQYKYDYTYDVNNNVTQDVIYSWNTGTSTWDNYSRYTYTYDSHQNETSYLYETWTSGTWVNYDKVQYTYDANNNETGYESFLWNTGTSAWVPSSAYTYTFNSNNYRTYELYQTYNGTNLTLENSDQYFFYYTTINTGITESKNDFSATLYPNPSNGNNLFVNLNLEQNTSLNIYVYDACGNVISRETRPANSGSNNIQLDNQRMSAGNYFVQINDRAGKTSVLKFIVQ